MILELWQCDCTEEEARLASEESEKNKNERVRKRKQNYDDEKVSCVECEVYLHRYRQLQRRNIAKHTTTAWHIAGMPADIKPLKLTNQMISVSFLLALKEKHEQEQR